MKKIIILFFTFLTCICTPIDAATKGEGDNRIDVSTRVAVGEYWGERWNSKDNRIFISIRDNKFVITLYPRTEEVWNHYCKITISDFMIPDKKIRQEHVKKSLDYIYECTVDFYYNVEYPSLEECFANYGGFVVNSKAPDAKKRTVVGKLRLNAKFFSCDDEYKAGDWMMARLLLDEVGLDISFSKLLYFKK